MNSIERVTPTPAQEQQALAWLSLLHDQPSSGDQATFSQWLQADPAHAEAYARAQVLWELSEVPARTLADEDALALQGYLNAMNRSRRSSVRRWSGALAMAACLLLMISLGSGWQPVALDRRSGRRLCVGAGANPHRDAGRPIASHARCRQRHCRGFQPWRAACAGASRRRIFQRDPHRRALCGRRREGPGAGAWHAVRGAPATPWRAGHGVVGSGWRDGGRNAEQQILTAGQQVAYGEGSAQKLHAVDSEASWRGARGGSITTRRRWPMWWRICGAITPGGSCCSTMNWPSATVSGSFPSKNPQAVLSSLQGVLGFEQHQVLGHLIILR